MTRTVRLAGTSLELVEGGQGRPLLFLHAGEGLAPDASTGFNRLSQHYCVTAPWHPGYGASPLIDGGASGVRPSGLSVSRSIGLRIWASRRPRAGRH